MAKKTAAKSAPKGEHVERTFTCEICGNSFRTTADVAVCNGINTTVAGDGSLIHTSMTDQPYGHDADVMKGSVTE